MNRSDTVVQAGSPARGSRLLLLLLALLAAACPSLSGVRPAVIAVAATTDLDAVVGGEVDLETSIGDQLSGR